MSRIALDVYKRQGVECAAMRNEDMEVTAIYTRLEPKEGQILTADAQVLPITALDTQALDDNRPDVLLLCGGSAEDLPGQSAGYARDYHIAVSYTHLIDLSVAGEYQPVAHR